MSRSLALALVVLLANGVTNAYATVGGQTYAIEITASSSGDLNGEIEFVDGPSKGDSGEVGIDLINADDYSGTYTSAGKPTVVTNFSVSSIAPNDGLFASFSGSAIDLKQASGIIGRTAQKLAIPGTITGFGFSTSGDLFLFVGTEVLP